MHYIYSLLHSTLLLAVCTHLLPHRLKYWQTGILFAYLYIAVHFAMPFDWFGPYLIMGGAFVLIYIFSPSRLVNVCFASFGYLLYVVVRQIYLISAKALLGIRPPQMHREYLIYFTGFCLLTVGLITGISGWLLRKKSKIHLFPVSKNLVICIFLYLMLCTCMFIFNTTYAKTLGYPPHIIGINGLLFGIFFLFSAVLLWNTFRIWKKEFDSRLMLERQEQVLEYTKTLEYLYQSMRSFRHDYVNILSTLQGYMMEDDMDGLKAYFQESILPLGKAAEPSAFDIGNLSNMKIPEIKGLLYNKIIYAASQGIHVRLNIPKPFTRVSMDHVDLCRVLGIYLDNATEAACQSEKKQMDLFFLQEGCASLAVGNTCQPLSLPLSSLSEPGTTTKGNGRGTGLYTVSQILSRYPSVLQNTSYHDDYFEQHLENL